MNFNHLKVFWSVAKNLSFSRAANELYISQPTVSVQVKKLEEELGIKLVEQLGKKIYPTEAGRLLYTYANRIFTLAAEAESAVQELKGLHSGNLVIGASSTPGIYLLPDIIGSFQRIHPGLKISLEISNTHKVQEQLLQNQLDWGIVGEELLTDPQLQVEPLLVDELVLIAAVGNPLAQKDNIDLEDLTQQPLILRERGSSTREVLEEKFRSHGYQLKVALQLSSVEAIKKAVAADLGVSIISGFAVRLETAAGTLKTVSLKDLSLVREINLVYHKDKKFSPSTQEFLSHLRQSI